MVKLRLPDWKVLKTGFRKDKLHRWKPSERVVKRVLLVFLIAFIFSAAILTFSNSRVTSVFSHTRELPIYSVETSCNVVSITFDCAWGADDIPKILNTLDKNNVKATFFVVGQWAEKYPDKIRMIAARGHDLANHSYSHFRMSTLDNARIESEIIKCGDLLKEATGSKIFLFRAPYGDYNNNVIRAAKRLGYFAIQWNVDSLDWKPGISREEITNRVFSKVKPGSIILFHNDTKYTADLLDDIITGLRSRGYDFLPVSKLILKENFYIDHEGRQRGK